MKKYSIGTRIIFIAALAVNAFIIVNAAITGSVSAAESGGFSRFLANFINLFNPNAINDSNFDSFASVVRKLIGHFALFGLDGILSTLSIHLFLKETKFKNALYVLIFSLGLGLVVAMISELIQMFTPDRFGSWLDVLIDFSGYALGFGITLLILLLTKSLTFKKSK